MILLYTLMLITLALIGYLVKLRAAALERRHARVALECNKLVSQQLLKEGNSNRLDACKSARRQYLLGQLVHKRDRLEAKQFRWQLLAERLQGWLTRLAAWKGRKIPYTMGALDVWLFLSLIDNFGVGRYLSVKTMLDSIVRLLGS